MRDLEKVVRNHDGIELTRAAELLGFSKQTVKRHAIANPYIAYHRGTGFYEPSHLVWKFNPEWYNKDLEIRSRDKTTYTPMHLL